MKYESPYNILKIKLTLKVAHPMAAKIVNRMKFQMWTPDMTIKSEGSLVGGVVHAFEFLSLEQQQKAFEKITEILNKAKAKKELKDGQSI